MSKCLIEYVWICKLFDIVYGFQKVCRVPQGDVPPVPEMQEIDYSILKTFGQTNFESSSTDSFSNKKSAMLKDNPLKMLQALQKPRSNSIPNFQSSSSCLF